MCGIAGIYTRSRGEISLRRQIISTIAPLSHRGPDAWGTYVGNTVALGHVRLSIIDLAAGHQPMATDRSVISYNGEIYNYIELREELQKAGAVFTTRSDTEVAIKAYELWGTDAFSRFNGQYAILLWDKARRLLVAARDRYGVRPLFVMRHDQAWYFASEMKAFDGVPGFKREYDIHNLFEHGLLWNTIGSDTVYKGIRSIVPGTCEIYSGDSDPVVRRYYSLGSLPRESTPEIDTAQDQFRDLLCDSVRLRLRSDVPVGVYLSGGIDSSVIALLTSEVMGERFKSFSITFSDPSYDESSYQNEMVALLGSDHHPIRIDHETINDNFLEAVYHAERPLFRTAPLPLFMLSRLVRENGIKVVLTGEAADEILYGYDSYKELKLLQFWSRHPGSAWRPLLIKRLYPHLQHYADTRSYGLMKMYYEEFLTSYRNGMAGLNIRVRNNTVLAAAFRKEYGIKYDEDDLLAKIRGTLPPGHEAWTIFQLNQYLEMTTLLSGYLLSSQGDRMALGHGVEARFPFLDHRLIEKLFWWPDTYKMKVFSQKHLLRSAFRGRIPDSIIDRPKLPYQAPDLKAFIRNGKPTDVVDNFMSPELVREYGVFDERFVARFLKKFAERPPEQVGYRDNMMLVFMLSAQMALYWARNPRCVKLNEGLRTVDLFEQNAVGNG